MPLYARLLFTCSRGGGIVKYWGCVPSLRKSGGRTTFPRVPTSLRPWTQTSVATFLASLLIYDLRNCSSTGIGLHRNIFGLT